MTPRVGQDRTWRCGGVQSNLSFPIFQGHWTSTPDIPTVYNINKHIWISLLNNRVKAKVLIYQLKIMMSNGTNQAFESKKQTQIPPNQTKQMPKLKEKV